MATVAEHQRQAEHNQKFLDSIDSAAFPDWKTTVAFYKSVHVVQALLVAAGERCKSHSRRNAILRSKFPDVWKEYHPLYSYSRLSRYWCFKVKPDHVAHVLRRLGRIERAAKHQMEKLRRSRKTP
jgi:hypothetical protein